MSKEESSTATIIRDLTLFRTGYHTIEPNQANGLARPIYLVPTNNGAMAELEVSDNQFIAPTRLIKRYQTPSINEGVRYIVDNAKDFNVDDGRVESYIDIQGTLECHTVFNIGSLANPGFADIKASIKPKPTAEWNAVLALSKQKIHSVSDMLDFIADWSGRISFYKDSEPEAPGEQLPYAKVCKTLRDMKVKNSKEANFKQSANSESQGMLVNSVVESEDPLAELMVFRLEPYADLKPVDVYVSLAYRTDGDHPTIVTRIIGLEKMIENIGNNFMETIREKVGENSAFYIGSVSTR